MIDPKKIEEMARQIHNALPPGIKSLGEEVDKKVKQVLQSQLNRLDMVSREEFDELKRQVEDMLEILKVAKLYDEENGEPDCAMDEKVGILRKVAELVGVDLSEVFGKKDD